MSADTPQDAASYNGAAILRNGAAVRIRAVRPDDKERLAAAFRKLQKESIYTRFFYDKQDISPGDLKSATEVDFETVVALVVTIGGEGAETIIGGGRFTIIDPTAAVRRAEVVFTVDDDYHNQGMAGLLLQHLTGIARRMRVHVFEAEVLDMNRGMLDVFDKSGLPMSTSVEGDVVHVTLQLGPQG